MSPRLGQWVDGDSCSFLQLPRLLCRICSKGCPTACRTAECWTDSPPTQPKKCHRFSIFETLQASINKCGVSLAAAHSLGKATAEKALTWRFTQTLSGFAIRQQQNVRLLLSSLRFTGLSQSWHSCSKRTLSLQQIFSHRAAAGHWGQTKRSCHLRPFPEETPFASADHPACRPNCR